MSSVVVTAALDDLEALARALRSGQDELQPVELDLLAAIERAWATSGGFLGPRPGFDAVFDGRRRRVLAIADACDGAALQLRVAGGGTGLRAVLPGAPAGPAARLAAHDLAARLFGDGGALRERVVSSFHRPAAVAAFVVRTDVDRLQVGLVGDASVRIVRELRSDGTVHLSRVSEAAAAVGPGLGASCTVQADGLVLADASLAAAASTRLRAGVTETWEFDDAASADAWLAEHRLALRFTPTGLAQLAVPEPTRRSEVVAAGEALEAVAGLGLAELTGALAAGGGMDVALRHNGDGTVTAVLTGSAQASAEGHVVLAGAAQAGFTATMELTIEAGTGRLVAFDQHITERDQPNLALTVPSAAGTGSLSVTATELSALHTYDTTVSIDFTDPATRAALQQHLGVDATTAAGQLRAVLAAAELDPAALAAAAVVVTERTNPAEQSWALGCDIEAIVGEVPVALAGGHSSQRTLAAAAKAPGERDLQPLAVPPAPALAVAAST